jgi:hypothetical protein
MAKTNYRTWTVGEVVTAAMLNQQIKDNGNEIWKGTAAGDTDYYDSATTKTKLSIGSSYSQLTVVGGVPAWTMNRPGVILYGSVAQSIPNGTGVTDITAWPTEYYDEGAFHSGSASGIVIPTGMTGYYDVSINGYWDAHATAGKLRAIYINRNGTSYYGTSASTDDSDGAFHQSINMLIYAAQAEYIRVAVVQTSGGALNFNGGYFSCVRRF